MHGRSWSHSKRRRQYCAGGVFARLRPTSGDDGLTLIEVMVSLVIFSLAATALASGLLSAVKKSGNDRNRAAATNLAQRELEIVRNAFTSSETGALDVITNGVGTKANPSPLPGGTAGQPLRIDGRPYTVTRTIGWLATGVGASACDGGASVTYPSLAVGVKVSWPGLASTSPPVEANTVLTPPKGVLNSTTSFVAVKVIDAAGKPNEGRTVVLRKTSGGGTVTATTTADGCAVFGVATTGAHTVELNEVDYVDLNGIQLASKAITITSSSFQRLDFSYDAEAKVVVRITTDAGFAIPAGVASVTLGSTGFTTGYKTYAASSSVDTTIGDLWPIGSGYSVWAGSCEQSDPASAGGSRPAAVIVAPGATSPVFNARLAPVTLSVTNSTNGPRPGSQVVAVPLSSTGCSAAEAPLNLGVADGSGMLRTSLPAGTWELTVVGATEPTSGWKLTPSLLPTSAAQSITVGTA